MGVGVGLGGGAVGLFKAATGAAGVAAGAAGTLGSAAIESTVVASSMAGVGRDWHRAQRVPESIRGLKALRRVLGDRHENNLVERRRQSGMQFDGRLGRLFNVGGHDGIVAGGAEMRCPVTISYSDTPTE